MSDPVSLLLLAAAGGATLYCATCQNKKGQPDHPMLARTKPPIPHKPALPPRHTTVYSGSINGQHG